MAAQLTIELPVRVARGRADFYVSPANALAVAMIDRPEGWPGGKLALSGPAGAGKTHLAHVWAAQSGARIVSASELAGHDLPDLSAGPLVVEDVPAIAGDADLETALFHLHNLSLAAGQGLLLTGRAAPRRWGLALPDLQSRMEGAAHVALDPPDDNLLAAVMGKLFADRQIAPKETVIPYLINRMERSFAAAERVVALLDKAALEQRREVNRELAREILGEAAG